MGSCSVCGEQTDLACSDCKIDNGEIVYVCQKTACRDKHEADRKCNPEKGYDGVISLQEWSVEDKLNRIISTLLQDTRKGKVRWRLVDRDRMRTVSAVPLNVEQRKRRYVFLTQGSDYTTVSISEPYGSDIFWSYILPTSDAIELYQEALKHQEEINRILDEIIEGE